MTYKTNLPPELYSQLKWIPYDGTEPIHAGMVVRLADGVELLVGNVNVYGGTCNSCCHIKGQHITHTAVLYLPVSTEPFEIPLETKATDNVGFFWPGKS